MDYLRIVLRVIHIGGGIFWVGAVLMLAFFLTPTIRATAEAGQKFAGYMMNTMKLTQWISAAAGLTVLAGFFLYGLDSHWFSSPEWMSSGAGAGFGIGGALGLVGFIFGIMTGSVIRSLGKLGAQIQGQPTAAQATQMQALQKRQAMSVQVTAYSLILAVILMSIARYLHF